MPRAAPPMCAAFESTDRPDTPLVGNSTAEPSASTERKPPRPRSSPSAPSTTGAGMAPWKLDGTWLWLAESGFGSDALDRKSTRLNSSHLGISYAVLRLKKKKYTHTTVNRQTSRLHQ